MAAQRPVRRRRRFSALSLVPVTLLAPVAMVMLPPQAAAAEIVPLPPSGTITVLGHGNGHGHGMSQYGAQGAALRGLSATQIVAFFYPNTALRPLTSRAIRVALSGTGPYVTVAAASGLRVTGYGAALSTAGVSRYRLVPEGAGFLLQGLRSTGWFNALRNLPSPAYFTAPAGFERTYRSDLTSADYRGSVGAVRSGTGEIALNSLPLDSYVLGVVPRESPSYWEPAALQAQAIAARTYARYAMDHAGGRAYDTCDTDQCQVYGGRARYSSNGTRLFGEEPSTTAAVTVTANRVLQYAGLAIFAQFSASDGGWTVDGGQPYLVAHRDPYDDAASGDPYLNWTRAVRVADIANAYGLRTVTQIEITARDGNGDWGGRVLSGYIDGVDRSGQVRRIATSGFGLQAAMGLPHNWFFIKSVPVDRTRGASAISPTSSSVAMFFRDAASHVQARTYVNGRGWNVPQDLGAPAGGATWDPDAATYGDGHVDVAIRESDGHLAIRTYVPASGWAPWLTRPVVLRSSPAAVSPAPNWLFVIYRGPGGSLWTVDWSRTHGWSAARAIPGIANAASGPDAMAAVETTGDITVVYRGTDNRLWTVRRASTTGWKARAVVNPSRPLPAAPAAVDPTVTDDGTGAPSVYYAATNGVVYHSALDPATGSWSAWWAVPETTSVTGAPDAAHEGTAHIDLVAGSNGAIRRTSWTSAAGWSRWALLT